MCTIKKRHTPLVLTDTTNLDRQTWLNFRRQGIGGSDVAAILGISPFMTARDLYYDKKNIVSVTEDNSYWVQREVGNLLEDLVAKIFSLKTGYRVYKIKKMFMHPVYKFMLADVDFFVELPNGEKAILETKTTGYNNKEKWIDEYGMETIPPNYISQGCHYMAVMDIDLVFYCCLYDNGFDSVFIRSYQRERNYESELIHLEKNYWHNHVLADVPPPYTENGQMIINSTRRHFGPCDPKAPKVELNKHLSVLLSTYLELKEQKSIIDAQANKLKKEIDQVKGHLIAEMGTSCNAICMNSDEAFNINNKLIQKNIITKDNLYKLKMQYPDIYNEYVTASVSQRFSVQPISIEALAA